MFVRKVKTASGAIAVQIVRRENRRDVVIEHLGSAHTDAEIGALVQVWRRKIEDGQGVLDLGPEPAQDRGEAIIETKISRLVIDAVTAAWCDLGFGVITDEGRCRAGATSEPDVRLSSHPAQVSPYGRHGGRGSGSGVSGGRWRRRRCCQ